MVTTPEIAATLTQRVHFNTFGGNPVSCAIGKAVLEVIDREHLQQNAHAMGQHLLASLHQLQQRHAAIGDVRGLGLMVAMEFVKDRATKEPAKETAADFFERCKDLGLLVGKGGLHGNIIRITPPLCITKADVDFLLEVMEQALGEME